MPSETLDRDELQSPMTEGAEMASSQAPELGQGGPVESSASAPVSAPVAAPVSSTGTTSLRPTTSPMSATSPPAVQSPAAQPAPAVAEKPASRRRLLIVAAVLAVAIVLIFVFGIPRLIYMFNHASTDDAVVNSHVTYVSARVDGVAEDVLVDDNQFVDKGTPLVRIDARPFEIVAAQKQAALESAKRDVDKNVAALAVAKAELAEARDAARSRLAGLEGNGYLAASVRDLVLYEESSLQSGVANLRLQQANLVLARQEYDRAVKLGAAAMGEETIEQRSAALDVAKQNVATAEQSIQQTRALLELPPDYDKPGDVPPGTLEKFSALKYALANADQSLAQLGLPFLSSQTLGALDDKLRSIETDIAMTNDPAVVAAEARVNEALAALGGSTFDPANPYNQPDVARAQKELEDAQLQLSYCDLTAPLAGYVSRRTVNPGTHVSPGQGLLAIRPLRDVWVDANFKETQLNDLRIGQPVEIHVDAYPDKTFHGRVAGFSAGTGAVMSLLPPENATGNFVKVVQRLPVRIDLTDPLTRDYPLFAGLSVTPEVDIKAEPTGPDAGQRLQSGAVNSAGVN